ncbi:PRC and DUF2382 domain-containing protein [Corynebacterium riegelii]|uniref:Photosystem reaction center subunit H n=1 Tax=Corynebacterium riegelii TaxID=156976 RepID=A0A0K1RDW5_9CORY|nr:PRC and DUF2382 domain-containing protein [Corynebacterium riegelii]AKV59625.1 hypothetical protein AK829_11385 [Corynebacterium riegelii]
MTNLNRIEDLANATAYDVNGDKVGSVQDVYVNDTTGQPDFITVNHGLFGTGTSIVPLRGHSLRDGDLHLAFPKDRIEDAPDLDDNGHLTTNDQDALYRHYALTETQDVTTYETGAPVEPVDGAAGAGAAGYGVDAGATDAGATGAGVPAAGVGAAAAGVGAGAAGLGAADAGYADGVAGTADAGVAGTDSDELIRSEEQLNVSKDRVESGEVHLRKYVVTETETVEVPVEREEVRIVREPITEADRAAHTGAIGEAEASVTLHEDQVTVTKESVPVEKVSLETETVRDTETVSEEVRKERFETDGVVTDGDADLR